MRRQSLSCSQQALILPRMEHTLSSSRYQQQTMMKHKHEGWWKKIDCVIKRMLMVMVDGEKERREKKNARMRRKIRVTQLELNASPTHSSEQRERVRCLHNYIEKGENFFHLFLSFSSSDRRESAVCRMREREMGMFLLFSAYDGAWKW